MKAVTTQGNDQAHGDQCDVESAAFLYSGKSCLGLYRIESISIGGVVLAGRCAPAKRKDVRVVLLASNRRQLSFDGMEIYQECRGKNDFLIAVAFRQRAPIFFDTMETATFDLSEYRETSSKPVVLVVDDSFEICRALERDLRVLGHNAIIALTPLDAVMWLMDPDVHIEAAVVDLFLGKYDGLELLNFMTKRRPDVHRVLISGQVRLNQLKLAQSSGRAQAVVSKPWSRSELARALKTWDQ